MLFKLQFCSPEIVLGLFQKKLRIRKPAVSTNVIYFTWRTFSIFPNFVQLGFVGYNFHLGTVQTLLVLVMDTNNSNSKIIWTLDELKKILKKIPVYILSYVTVFIEHFILLQKTGSKENLFPTFLFELGKCFWEAVLKHQKLMALVFSLTCFAAESQKSHWTRLCLPHILKAATIYSWRTLYIIDTGKLLEIRHNLTQSEHVKCGVQFDYKRCFLLSSSPTWWKPVVHAKFWIVWGQVDTP